MGIFEDMLGAFGGSLDARLQEVESRITFLELASSAPPADGSGGTPPANPGDPPVVIPPAPTPDPDPDPDPIPVPPSTGTMASSVTRRGSTWTFAAPRPVGTFANGDPWVVGPVQITAISPPVTVVGSRVRNGSMLNPKGGRNTQGYDSSLSGMSYQPALNVALGVSPSNPLEIASGSLVSTTTDAGSGVRPQLLTAEILTVVSSVPVAGAFRPAYCAPRKDVSFKVSDLDTSKLLSLSPAPGAPSLASVERSLERVWLDHGNDWSGRNLHPAQNMPNYGRSISADIGKAALVLSSSGYSIEQKMPLLISMIQLGIDFHGLLRDGNTWPANGGHASGRKFPILFAGELLGDAEMLGVGASSAFGEDQQTFFVSSANGKINGGHGGYTAADVGMADWGIRHASDPSRDDKSWSSSYRQCCTANAWGAQALIARLMGLESVWVHPAFFAYVARYMAIQPAGDFRSWDSWSGAMWDLHHEAPTPNETD